jgi:hypothetical protein
MSAHPNLQLFSKTDFGFGSVVLWPTAVSRVAFFAVASGSELLAATRLFGWIVDGVARGMAAVLTILTPHAAADLQAEPPRHGLRILIWATGSAAVVTSLGGNAVFTALEGTFDGTDSHRYYYSHDLHNLILYTFVVPIYMAASAAIVYCALSSFSFTGQVAQEDALSARIWRVLRLAFVLSGIVLVAGLVQVNYFRDNIMGLTLADPGSLLPMCRDRVFWFMEEVSRAADSKILRLNSAGVYYLCMQFSHMALIAAGVWFTVTAMFTLYRLGLSLTPQYLARNGGAEPVRARLQRFSLLELSAKCLVLILTVHIYIWRDSCLKGDHNIRVTAMALLAFAFFILATPRLLIEYRLLKCAAVDPGQTSDTVTWPDLVDQRDKLTSTIISGMHFIAQITLALFVARLVNIARGR